MFRQVLRIGKGLKVVKTRTWLNENLRCSYSSLISESDEEITFERLQGADDGIITASFNRPAVKNAVNRNLIKRFSVHLDSLSYHQSARVLILRSLTPGIFCSGADLKERSTLTTSQTSEMVCRFRSLTNQIESLPIPVIAAVDGIALGGGFEIALACDIRVASSDSKLGLVETRLAIIPGAGGTQRLPRIAGVAVAKELIFTARVITGRQAKEYGILNHLVQQNDLGTAAYTKALDIAREILPNGPVGVRMAKSAINSGCQVDLNTGCAIEESCYAQVLPTNDRLEGLKAFLGKRLPKYSGK